MTDTPDWFWTAVETPSTQASVTVDGEAIKYLSWSPAGKPGLLFIHGHNAHSHWWDFIAPAFMENHQVAAVDLSGMGDSDHRETYSADIYSREICAVADALEMPADTVLVAHSFGGIMALRAMAANPGRFAGLVLVDSGVRHPDEVRERDPQLDRLARPKVYPSREIALSRFRLQPPQQCANQYLVDHIARHSVEHDGDGWVWKFDVELLSRFEPADPAADLAAIAAPVALVYGELSESFSNRSAEHMLSLNPGMKVIAMADAQHHLFLDQPEVFIDTLKGLLADWAG